MFEDFTIFVMRIGWSSYHPRKRILCSFRISFHRNELKEQEKMGGHKSSQDEFVKKAKAFYGDFFDLTKVIYRGAWEYIIISSERFGEEKVLPGNFLSRDYRNRKRKNQKHDKEDKPLRSSYTQPSLRLWNGIYSRCYRRRSNQKSYEGCTMCEEWLTPANFKSWFECNYIEGYQIDKDIIKKGNKVYCPQYCVFVPREINLLIAGRGIRRTKYPMGVRPDKTRKKFIAYISIRKKVKHLGTYNTIEEAFITYKDAKEAHIKQVAQEYFDAGKISKRVYDALMRYEVAITD